eukprot:4517804-Pyramimonas_sp.AAC.1
MAGGTRKWRSADSSPAGLVRSKALLQSSNSRNSLPFLSSSASSMSLRTKNSASLVPRAGRNPH